MIPRCFGGLGLRPCGLTNRRLNANNVITDRSLSAGRKGGIFMNIQEMRNAPKNMIKINWKLFGEGLR